MLHIMTMNIFGNIKNRSRRLVMSISFLLAILCSCGIELSHALDLKIVDPLVPLRNAEDLAEALAEDKLIINAPRNGFGSAVLVLTSPGSDVDMSVSDLKCGDESLSGDVITVRYAALAEQPELISFKAMGTGSDRSVLEPYYDTLLDSPSGNPEILPVWLTAEIPEDAKPGIYEGKVTAGTKAVDIVVNISHWTCPDPNKWEAHAGVLSSPETLAIQYNKELWSDEHWKLVEKELQFVGGLGNDDLWISVLPYNHFGQQKPWITFTKESGGIVPDLKLLERYLDLYSEHVGQPGFLLLELWNSNRYGRGRRGVRKSTDVIIDGKPQSVPLPGFEGAEDIWVPLMAAVRTLVTKKGWPESIITLGCADDIRPGSDVNAFFQKHSPYAKWAIWTHGRGDPPPWKGVLKLNGLAISHYEHLFCPHTGADRDDGMTGGWDLSFREYGTARNLIPKYIRPTQYRQLPEGMMVNMRRASQKMSRSSAGVTRLCLDYWRVKIPGDPGGRVAPLLLAYENKPWSIFYRNNARSLIEPGPDGPVSTVRYEMLREGMQECEARIAIEQALEDGKLKGKSATAARTLLSARLKARENGGAFQGGHVGDVLGGRDHLWGIGSEWRQSSKLLFEIAGEISD